MKVKLDKERIQASEAAYYNFILNALTGRTPDEYFRQNEAAIRYYAHALRTTSRLEACQLYRGVLLDPASVPDLKLKPEPQYTFLSFSERIEIAECFADLDHAMAIFVKGQTPHFQGYTIKHFAQPSEIIFHWKWTEPLQLERYLNTNVLFDQREVMLFQSGHVFDLKPFTKGTSLKHGYNPGHI